MLKRGLCKSKLTHYPLSGGRRPIRRNSDARSSPSTYSRVRNGLIARSGHALGAWKQPPRVGGCWTLTFPGSPAPLVVQVPMALPWALARLGLGRVLQLLSPAELRALVASFGPLSRRLFWLRLCGCGSLRLCGRLRGFCALLRPSLRRCGVCSRRHFSLPFFAWGSSLPSVAIPEGFNVKFVISASAGEVTAGRWE
jgi:hypothetical protein